MPWFAVAVAVAVLAAQSGISPAVVAVAAHVLLPLFPSRPESVIRLLSVLADQVESLLELLPGAVATSRRLTRLSTAAAAAAAAEETDQFPAQEEQAELQSVGPGITQAETGRAGLRAAAAVAAVLATRRMATMLRRQRPEPEVLRAAVTVEMVEVEPVLPELSRAVVAAAPGRAAMVRQEAMDRSF